MFKRDEPTDKKNYRTISLLNLLSKIFQRLIYELIF